MKTPTLVVAAALLATPAFAQTTTAPQPGAPATMNQTINQTTTAQWRASKLIGVNVYNQQNEKLGEINELILSPNGQIAGAVIGVGGFLGIGERNVALTMDKLRIAPQPDGSVKLTLDLTKEQLSSAPAFKSRKDVEAEKRAAERPPAGPGQRRPGQ